MKKYGYTEIRKISSESLRSLCIKNNWYTNGDNEEYGHLLIDLADSKDNITTDDIVEIAQDIYDHSYTDYDVESIMFAVLQIANTYIERD